MDSDWKKLLGRTWSSLTRDTMQSSTEEQTDTSYYFHELDTYHRQVFETLKRTEEEKQQIRKNEQLYSLFFERAPIGYLVLSMEGMIENANEIASDYWEIEHTQLVGIGIYGLIIGDDVRVLSRAMVVAKNSFQKQAVEIQCVRPGGSTFWGRFDIILSQDSVASKPQLLCSIVDVTSDRIIEDAIKKTSVGLAAATGGDFFRYLTDFLVTYPGVDMALVSRLNSKKVFEALSLSSQKEINRQKVQYPISESLLTDKVPSRYFGPNSVHGEIVSQMLDAKNGIGIFLFDQDRNICGEIMILSKEFMDKRKLYSSILKVISVRTNAELDRYIADLRQKEYRQSLEELVESRTKHLAKEIEKRKETEIHLRKAKITAEEATRAKSIFLANMSHEVRTPINGILGVASLMGREPLDKKLQEYVSIIKKSGDSLMRIINDILDFSKLEADQIEIVNDQFNLQDLIHDVIEIHASQAEKKKISLYLLYAQDCPQSIHSDRIRLRQVLENLLSNAIKFTTKGIVVVEIKLSDSRKSIDISVTDTGIGMTPLQHEKIFQRFAQADSSTTRKFGGSGLGLSISKRITKLLGGKLSSQSKVDHGSSFQISLPCDLILHKPLAPSSKKSTPHFLDVFLDISCEKSRQLLHQSMGDFGMNVIDSLEDFSKLSPNQSRIILSTEARSDVVRLAKKHQIDIYYLGNPSKTIEDNAHLIPFDSYISSSQLLECVNQEKGLREELPSPASPETSNKLLKNKSVLMAEDNLINQMVAAEMLRMIGLQVDIANDGLEAVQKAKSQHYDVILMDCLMPNMDGFEALKVIKETVDHSLPIIAVTANAMKGDRETCIKSGFDDYISKPLRIEDLQELLSQALSPRN